MTIISIFSHFYVWPMFLVTRLQAASIVLLRPIIPSLSSPVWCCPLTSTSVVLSFSLKSCLMLSTHLHFSRPFLLSQVLFDAVHSTPLQSSFPSLSSPVWCCPLTSTSVVLSFSLKSCLMLSTHLHFSRPFLLSQVLFDAVHSPPLQSSFPSLSSPVWCCPLTSTSVVLSFSLKSCLLLSTQLHFSRPSLLSQVLYDAVHSPPLQSSFPSLSSPVWCCPLNSTSVVLSFSLKSCLMLSTHLHFSRPFLLSQVLFDAVHSPPLQSSFPSLSSPVWCCPLNSTSVVLPFSLKSSMMLSTHLHFSRPFLLSQVLFDAVHSTPLQSSFPSLSSPVWCCPLTSTSVVLSFSLKSCLMLSTHLHFSRPFLLSQVLYDAVHSTPLQSSFPSLSSPLWCCPLTSTSVVLSFSLKSCLMLSTQLHFSRPFLLSQVLFDAVHSPPLQSSFHSLSSPVWCCPLTSTSVVLSFSLKSSMMLSTHLHFSRPFLLSQVLFDAVHSPPLQSSFPSLSSPVWCCPLNSTSVVLSFSLKSCLMLSTHLHFSRPFLLSQVLFDAVHSPPLQSSFPSLSSPVWCCPLNSTAVVLPFSLKSSMMLSTHLHFSRPFLLSQVLFDAVHSTPLQSSFPSLSSPVWCCPLTSTSVVLSFSLKSCLMLSTQLHFSRPFLLSQVLFDAVHSPPLQSSFPSLSSPVWCCPLTSTSVVLSFSLKSCLMLSTQLHFSRPSLLSQVLYDAVHSPPLQSSFPSLSSPVWCCPLNSTSVVLSFSLKSCLMLSTHLHFSRPFLLSQVLFDAVHSPPLQSSFPSLSSPLWCCPLNSTAVVLPFSLKSSMMLSTHLHFSRPFLLSQVLFDAVHSTPLQSSFPSLSSPVWCCPLTSTSVVLSFSLQSCLMLSTHLHFSRPFLLSQVLYDAVHSPPLQSSFPSLSSPVWCCPLTSTSVVLSFSLKSWLMLSTQLHFSRPFLLSQVLFDAVHSPPLQSSFPSLSSPVWCCPLTSTSVILSFSLKSCLMLSTQLHWSRPSLLSQVLYDAVHSPPLQSSFPSLSSPVWCCPLNSTSVVLSFSLKSCLMLSTHLHFSRPFILSQVLFDAVHSPPLQSSFPSLSSPLWCCPLTSTSVVLSFSLKSCLMLSTHLHFSRPFLLSQVLFDAVHSTPLQSSFPSLSSPVWCCPLTSTSVVLSFSLKSCLMLSTHLHFSRPFLLSQVLFDAVHSTPLQSSFPSLSSPLWCCPLTSTSVVLSFSLKSCLMLSTQLHFSRPFLLSQVLFDAFHSPPLQSSFPSLSSPVWCCPLTSTSVVLSFSLKSSMMLSTQLHFSRPFLLSQVLFDAVHSTPLQSSFPSLSSPLQPSTLSSWSYWPRGPVDLKSYWPPKNPLAPNFFQTT